MKRHDKLPALWANFFKLNLPQMRAFHMTWIAFFLCFLAWFGIAPLMDYVRDDLKLSEEQIGWSMTASVAITILARLVIGWLCDRYGPRRTYAWLLVLGSLPVMGIAFVQSYEAFLLARLLIGVIGASFVITQYHTSVMFAPNIVGTANATTAGWGNLGGGVTQLAMPTLVLLFVSVLGFSESLGWRAAMIVDGLICLLAGIAYYRFTQDTPAGNLAEVRRGKHLEQGTAGGAFLAACGDYRVWALAAIYGACFGVELTIHNISARYFAHAFDLQVFWAGMAASSFGVMNLFARTLGGLLSDRFAGRWGLRGRVNCLFLALFLEGLALMLFAQMNALQLAIPVLMLFALFVKMSEGATYAVVPFVNRRALGAVSGIVGAGGNVGAVLITHYLFRGVAPSHYGFPLLVLGAIVVGVSLMTSAVRFSSHAETAARVEFHLANEQRAAA